MTATNEYGRAEIVEPGIGSIWADSSGRVLVVTGLDPHSPLMRQVLGRIDDNDYACTLAEWVRVWRDKTQPANKREMTHG